MFPGDTLTHLQYILEQKRVEPNAQIDAGRYISFSVEASEIMLASYCGVMKT